MTPLIAEAGWGGTSETIACVVCCSTPLIVSFAVAGVAFRSLFWVGISAVLALAVVAMGGLSFCGYVIVTFAPLAAAYSFTLRERSDSDAPGDPEPAPGAESATDAIEYEVQPPHPEWVRSGPVVVRWLGICLFVLCMLFFLVVAIAMLPKA
jgi:hypothetical protein